MKIDFALFRSTVGKLADEVRNLRGQIESKKRIREEISAAPLAREDVWSVVEDHIDRHAAGFPERFMMEIDGLVKEGVLPGRPGGIGVNVLAAPRHRLNQPDVRDVQACLLGLLGDLLKPRIRQAVMDLQWPAEPGMPAVARKQRIEELDREITDLEGQLLVIEREAAAAGVQV